MKELSLADIFQVSGGKTVTYIPGECKASAYAQSMLSGAIGSAFIAGVTTAFNPITTAGAFGLGAVGGLLSQNVSCAFALYNYWC